MSVRAHRALGSTQILNICFMMLWMFVSPRQLVGVDECVAVIIQSKSAWGYVKMEHKVGRDDKILTLGRSRSLGYTLLKGVHLTGVTPVYWPRV